MSKSVVIIDDSKFQIMQLTRFFSETMGVLVAAAGENGEDAVSLYRAHKPDLLTMDLTMPKLGGREAIAEILKEFPDARILIISAIKGPLLVDCLALGAKSYVAKPLRLDREDFVREFKASLEEILASP